MKKDITRIEYNAYHRAYRKKLGEKWRKYQREWMQLYRSEHPEYREKERIANQLYKKQKRHEVRQRLGV